MVGCLWYKILNIPWRNQGGGDAYNFFSNLSLYYCKEWNFVKQVFQKTVNWPCLAIQWISKYGTDWRERKSIYWSILFNETWNNPYLSYSSFREIIARIKTCFVGDNKNDLPSGQKTLNIWIGPILPRSYWATQKSMSYFLYGSSRPPSR